MAHRSSSASLHTARVLLRHYDIAVRPVSSGSIPNLIANEAHLSIVIDYTSNAFEVAKVRPELRYWQQRLTARTASAPQIGMYIRTLIEALEKVPGYRKDQQTQIVSTDLPEESATVKWVRPKLAQWGGIPLGQYALDATRAVHYYFTLMPIKPPLMFDADAQFLDVAKLIHVSLGLHHALKALPLLRRAEPELQQGHLTETQIRSCLREVGLHVEQMPHYEVMEDETKLLA